jgi:hypothetical protein
MRVIFLELGAERIKVCADCLKTVAQHEDGNKEYSSLFPNAL